MMEYWANFAYSCQPGKGRSGELAEWSDWKSEEADNAAGQTIIFDTESDGGVCMAVNDINVAKLKSRLANDKSISDAKERCQLYA